MARQCLRGHDGLRNERPLIMSLLTIRGRARNEAPLIEMHCSVGNAENLSELK